MAVEDIILNHVLEILVMVLGAYAGIMWKMNRRLKDKASEKRLNSIESQLSDISNALFGNDDLDQQGQLEDKSNEIEQLRKQVQENNEKIDAVLLILSDELDSEHQDKIRQILTDDDNFYDTSDD